MFTCHPPNVSLLGGPSSPGAPLPMPVSGLLPGNSSECRVEPLKQPLPSPAMPIFSMTLGAVSNMVALAILVQSYARFRRRSKATFLLFASSLVITDFAGHVIPGAFVLQLYATRQKWDAMDSTGAMCQFFGACMVFFGLCPLFLGCVMAVERCVGVTRPLLHASLVTSVRTKLTLLGLWASALGIALLPIFSFGSYTIQHSCTWCFIKVQPAESWCEIFVALAVGDKAGALHYQRLLFLGVRLASWNQILDPWVYILLRRAVLRKLYRVLCRQPPAKGSRFERWEVSSFQSSDRSMVGRS
ncbi:prostaglandin E2 receptor EP1 subtype isoform X2 [Mauremys reevesii]|uniref:prostaglandin E2 receptor EP1 subtype isoform X2 n=1 Tax=Mauremys reevesii TaxID=260615 RepID=UPI00193FDD82|nr:prostaglandin E2 receptor EP1 subtype isoform X2 [Mauremys reevesii]